MRARKIAAAVVAVAALGGCASDPPDHPAAGPTLPNDVLYVVTDDALAALDVRSGKLATAVEGSVVASYNFDEVVVATPENQTTTVHAFSTDSWERTALLRAEGRLVARAVSGLGDLAVLTPPRPEGTDPYLPSGRARTRMYVAELSTGRVNTYRLDGNFEPEAFSADERFLYTIEYLPALNPNRYRVRVLNLRTGRVRPVVSGIKGTAPDQMRGTGRTQVPSPGGSLLYTLYTRQGPNTAHGAGATSPGHVYAFVHVLNLAEGWAHCVDLPLPFGTGDATKSAIATSMSGTRLFVADPVTDAVAVIDSSRLRVVRKGNLGFAGRSGPASATVNPAGDVLYVASGRTLKSFDATTLEPLDSWSLSDSAKSVDSSFDGSSVFVATTDGVVVIDVGSGRVVGEIEASGIERIVHVAASD